MKHKTVKENFLNAVNELPEKVSFEDAMERIYFLYKIEKGIQQADAGQVVSMKKLRNV